MASSRALTGARKPDKLRFMHERMHEALGHMDLRNLWQELGSAVLREHQAQRTGLAQETASKVANLMTSLAGPFWETTDERFIRRYVVHPDLYEAMLETEPPAEAFELDELRLPEHGIVIRWPNGEEAYVVDRDRLAEIKAAIHGARPDQVVVQSSSPHSLHWIQIASGAEGMPGAMWFGDIDATAPPQYGRPEALEETAQRQAMIRNLILYLTTDAALEAPKTSFKEPREAGPVTPQTKKKKKDRERFYNYHWIGSRTRDELERRQREANRSGEAIPDRPRPRFRVRVSGHWRHQAHGPRWTQRRWVWIMPYDKPDDPTLPYSPAHATKVRRHTS